MEKKPKTLKYRNAYKYNFLQRNLFPLGKKSDYCWKKWF